MTLLESKHSSKLNLSMLEKCEFVKFSFRQKYPAYGTVYRESLTNFRSQNFDKIKFDEVLKGRLY